MGKLAMWGAVAGGAKGVQEEIKQKRESRTRDLDKEREERLMALENKWAEKRQEKSFVQQEKMQGMKQEGAEQLLGAQQEFSGQQKEMELEHKAKEGQLDREAKLGVAEIGAATKNKKGDGDGYFTPIKMKITLRDENGFPSETERSVLRDRETQMAYYQDGKKYFPMGREPSDEENFPAFKGVDGVKPTKAEINAVIADAVRDGDVDGIYDFLGYVPGEVIAAKNRAYQTQQNAAP